MATIRPMTPADYPAVAAISAAAAQSALVGRPAWESEVDVAAEVSAVKQGAFVVAEDEGGRLIGLAGYSLGLDGEAALYGPLVTEQRHDIGTYLSSRIEAMARDDGATAYSMLIGLDNKQGAAWAQWRGYHLETEHPETLMTWVYPGELRTGGMPEGMRVRQAAAGDLDAVYALYQEAYPQGRLSREVWQGWLPDTWVAERDGQVVGFLHLIPATAWIYPFGVARAQRRQGIGTALLTGAVTAFWERQPRKVGLAVPLDNGSLVALFRRLGFRREIPVAKWTKREGVTDIEGDPIDADREPGIRV